MGSLVQVVWFGVRTGNNFGPAFAACAQTWLVATAWTRLVMILGAQVFTLVAGG